MRKHGDKEASKAQKACNRYVIVITSITDVTPELILELAEVADRDGVQEAQVII
jgi:hypothetical protein